MTILPVLLTLLLSHNPPAHVRATVWIRVGETANGTGWMVDVKHRWAVTAGHVVGDRDTAEVYFLDSDRTREHYLADHNDMKRRGLVAAARVIARRRNSDLALLEVDHVPPGIPALPLAAVAPRPGDVCRSVGHRHDAELMWNLTTGQVRQSGRLPDGYFHAGRRIGAGVPLVLLQAPIEAGESGSAVVNDAGEVIGVGSAVVNPVPELAIAIDVSEVRGLLADARNDAEPPAHSTSPADVPAALRATVWVRPQSTSGRAAGVLIDADRKLVLTSAAAVGSEPVVDIIAPKWDGGRIVPEWDAYADRLGLRLSGRCVAGMVLARDPDRDLALVELDKVPDGLESLKLAIKEPQLGDPIASVGHPTGIDMLWLYAAGTVRSVGNVSLNSDFGDKHPKVRSLLLQLPHQGSASGGPVVNAAGEVVGILASREAARQELGYAATPAEIRPFLDGVRPGWDPRTADEWVRRARIALSFGRTDTALRSCTQAMRVDQNNPWPEVIGAETLLVLGKRKDARELAESAYGPYSYRDPLILAKWAEVFRVLDIPDRAALLAERALKLDPRCAPALVVRARLKTGREAEQDVAAALDADPAYGPAYRVRAGLRDRISDEGRRQAVSDLGRAIELNPLDLEALRDRAALYRAANEPKKAVGDWSRLTELEPFNVNHWIGLARARFMAGDRPTAAEALRSALRVDGSVGRRVFGVVRDLGIELEGDNPADIERVSKWYATALNRLAAWLPE
jgi:S1-C subfamily serine protease